MSVTPCEGLHSEQLRIHRKIQELLRQLDSSQRKTKEHYLSREEEEETAKAFAAACELVADYKAVGRRLEHVCKPQDCHEHNMWRSMLPFVLEELRNHGYTDDLFDDL